jgi:hypothetical protein
LTKFHRKAHHILKLISNLLLKYSKCQAVKVRVFVPIFFPQTRIVLIEIAVFFLMLTCGFLQESPVARQEERLAMLARSLPSRIPHALACR